MRNVWVAIYCLCVVHVFAQQEVDISFARDSLQVGIGQTFKNELILKNPSNDPISIKIAADSTWQNFVLLDAPDTLVLAGHEQRVFPLKFFAEEGALLESRAIVYAYSVLGPSAEVENTVGFYLQVADSEIVWLDLEREHLFLPSDKSARELRFFLGNASINQRALRVEVVSDPEALQVDIEDLDIQLRGKEKKWVSIWVNNRYPSTNKGRTFPLGIILSDPQTGKTLASSHARVSTLGSVQYFQATHTGQFEENFVELSYNQNSRFLRNSQFRGRYSTQLGSGELSVATMAEYYHNQQGMNIYDTYLKYESRRWGAQVGTLQGENVDFNLNGRGVRLSFYPSDSAEIQLIGVDNNFHLYSEIYKPLTSAKSIGLIYRKQGRTFQNSRLSAIYSSDPMWNLRTGIVSFDASIKASNDHSLVLEGGLSHERYNDHDQGMPGFGAGLKYAGSKNGFSFFSDNYYSTKNYSGYRRGSLLLHERITRTWRKNRLAYASLNHARSNPRYHQYNYYFLEREKRKQKVDYWDHDFLWEIDELMYYPAFYNAETSILAGYSAESKAISFTLEPSFQKEERRSDKTYKMNSFRIKTLLSTSGNEQSASLQIHLGRSLDKISNEWFNNLRANFGYQWKTLGISGTVQFNPYFIGDLERQRNEKSFYNVSIRPHYNFSFLGRRLQGRTSISLDYMNSYSSWMGFAEGEVRYTIRSSWELSGTFRYTQIQQRLWGHEMYNTQFRVGVRKNLQKINQPSHHSVEILLYSDLDNDGQFSAHESPKPNVVVKLGDNIAITDEQGRVKFNNMPKGTYKMEIVSDSKWKASGFQTILLTKNTDLKVPLIMLQKVSGKLIENNNKYKTQRTDIYGIKVYAKNNLGQIYETYTDQNGHYLFNLPPDDYSIFIENRSFNFTKNQQVITVFADKDVNDIDFAFDANNIDIEVQKF